MAKGFTVLALAFPSIDPVLVSIGPLTIRWYALAYLAGFIGGWWLCLRLARARGREFPQPKDFDDFLAWAVIGTIVGGRLGYVFFYQGDYYLSRPSEALQIWQGGMSFHGGMLGVIVAALAFTRRRKLSFFAFTDVLAVVAPIGLGLGRLANFVNGELFGRASDVTWAVVFPRGGDLPRHPSQLYEAALEGVFLLVIMLCLFHAPRLREKTGLLSGSFLGLYALFRFGVEFFREPDPQLGFLFGGATMGQLLCLPMVAVGVVLVLRSMRRGIRNP